MKKYLPMTNFNLLYEIVMLNGKHINIQYPDGYSSTEILMEGSKRLPRKKKKKLRKLINI
jgi:hypothetical protein